MKILESKIIDIINVILFKIQDKLDTIRKNSFILSFLDVFIFLAIITTFIVSTFATTEIIGAVSFCVPALVVFKTLIIKGEKIELEQCNFFLLIYLLICLISCFTSSMLLSASSISAIYAPQFLQYFSSETSFPQSGHNTIISPKPHQLS